jgi:tRNA(fMet)-specific endonuclease VapC
MRWLLDTNVWIRYLKDPQSRVRARLEEKSPADIRCCSIVRAELLHGARKYGAPERRIALVQKTLAPYDSLPFDDAAAEHYATIRHELESPENWLLP